MRVLLVWGADVVVLYDVVHGVRGRGRERGGG